MARPTFIQTTLDEVNGSSCSNTPTHRMKDDGVSNPPQYLIDGVGDFAYARCVRVPLGGTNATWELTIVHVKPGECYLVDLFRREVDADDPVGGYVIYKNGQKEPTLGKASVADDD